MSNDPNQHHKVTDDELLANAIPIDTTDLESISDEDLVPIELETTPMGSTSGESKIRTFGPMSKTMKQWKRAPKKTGTGATHVKTFIAKLRMDAIDHLDEQVNQWLDEHPDYEVKFVTQSVGPLKGKTIEEALFLCVWV